MARIRVGLVAVAAVAVAVLALATGTEAVKDDREVQSYGFHDKVPLYVNKIGPYSSPSETYSYYHLPFCRPKDVEHKHKTLGEVLEGDELQTSRYDLRFLVNVEWQALCTIHVNNDEVLQLIYAIQRYYYFEFIYDNLPMWGFIGAIEKEYDDAEAPEHYYLFTHLHFNIAYNGDNVIAVNVTADQNQVKELTPGEDTIIEFSYSAKWVATNVEFEDRRKVYSEYSFFKRELEIHWLSIMNSFFLVVLLSGLLAAIVYRIVGADTERYNERNDDDNDYGWKLVHGDVFRFPSYPSLFSTTIGIGSQFTILVFMILWLAVIGVFYPGNRGAMKVAVVVIYALTAVIGGYVSATLYNRMGGQNWVWNIVQTALLYSLIFFSVWFILNAIAVAYNSTQSLPFGTIVLILIIQGVIGFPLTVIGGIAGKNSGDGFDFPCRTNQAPREIPEVPIYRQAFAQMMMAGFLPFSAIYIELYYVFASVWGHKPYTLYGILLLVFFILIIVTADITVATTYFQLAAEDHYWWWRSVFTGGSTAFFIYGYSIFYYLYRSEMSGTLQATYYFGYMFLACLGAFFMLGAVGFLASFVFVRRIYKNLKLD